MIRPNIPAPPDRDTSGAWIVSSLAVWAVAWTLEPEAAMMVPKAVMAVPEAICKALPHVMPWAPWAAGAFFVWAMIGHCQPQEPERPVKVKRMRRKAGTSE